METCAGCGAALTEGARFCAACGGEPARPAGDERKVATVLFADLVGSTELAGAQDPERTRATLDRFYDAMAEEVASAGGTVEKFVGDAVMAAFGAPAALEDHAERALHAALAMRHRLKELFDDRLQLRIGVNTGEVVVGRPREGSSFVTGDAVNVCARLEQNVAPGEILVGERTVQAARGAFEFDEPTTIEAKGKHEGVVCRRLLRSLTLMRPRGVGGLRAPFVGRESDLELLRTTFGRVVQQGEPHLVTMMGDAGVGKTRLVRELWQWLGDRPEEPLRRTGRCLPYGQAITYWPLGEILREHFGLLESDPPETLRERLGDFELLGLTLGLDVAGDLHPIAARDRLHEAWVEFLSKLAAERPLVLLLEDLHWAEEPLLDLLERLAREVQGPVLVIATARPELLDRRPAWGAGRRNASALWLEPLSPDHSRQLVDQLLAARLPQALRQVVVERAEGNPFFVEELTATLIDQGVLRPENGGWSVHDLPDDLFIPDSVQGVLAARIDLLPASEKAALQAAAVIGRTFWPGAVRELTGEDAPNLELLEERDFIRRRPGSSMTGEREYAIKHALTREVAYSTLPKARRARMHAAFAHWLERLEGKDELAPLLAHHFAEAVRPEDADLCWADEQEELAALRASATRWLRRHAELAVGRYEIAEAISVLERALELESREQAQAEIWREIGRANALRYDGESFWTAMQRSLSLSEDPATSAETYGELAFQTSLRAAMWKRRPDPELVTGWIDRAIELSAPDSRARVKGLVSRVLQDPAAAGSADAALEAERIAEHLGDADLRGYALAARSDVVFAAGQEHAAIELAQRAADLLGESDDPDQRAERHVYTIFPLVAGGRLDDARRSALRHAEVAESLTPHHRVHGVGFELIVETFAGNWSRAAELAPRAEDAVAGNVATPCVLNAVSLLVTATGRARLGDEVESRRLERSADELGMEGYEHLLGPHRILLALARDELDVVEPLLESIPADGLGFLDLTQWYARLSALAALLDRSRVEAEAPALVRPGTFLEPFALRALGVVRGDGELVRRATACFEEMGLDWHADQTRALL